MNSFEVITKYLPQAVDKFFVAESKSVILEQNPKLIDVNFQEAGYVKIASLLMDGLSDYYQTQQNSVDLLSPSASRPSNPAEYAAYAGNIADSSRDGFAIGGMDVTWEIFRLQYARGRQFRIDYIANEETANVVITNALEEFHRVKVIPEVDATRFSIIADQASASLGNLQSEVIAANTIISNFNNALEWETEHGVPEENVVFFVSPAVMTLIRNTSELAKFITQVEFRSKAGVNFTLQAYNGHPIIPVPSDRFFTNVLTTNNGYRAQSTSRLINYMAVAIDAVVPIRKIEWSKVYGPELSGLAGFHGYLINYLLRHGVVVPKNKIVGVYASVSTAAASTKANLLSIDTREGTVANAWVLNNYFTNPAGLRGTVVYKYDSAFTLGGAISSVGTLDEDYFAIALGGTAVSADNDTAYFAVVDASGTIVAVSGEVTLTKYPQA